MESTFIYLLWELKQHNMAEKVKSKIINQIKNS